MLALLTSAEISISRPRYLGIDNYILLQLQGIKLSTNHYLLLISATGEFIYLYFGIVAATTAFNKEILDKIEEHAQAQTNETRSELVAENALNFVTNSMDVVQIAVQTSALILATMGKTFNWRTEDAGKAKHILSEVLYYLCVCNAAKWITDSFIEGVYLKSSEAKILVFGETAWTAITQTSYPLVLFYRFHSVHMILKIIDNINSQ